MNKKISFYTWLQRYVNDNNAIGDLARDSRDDNKNYGYQYDDSGFPKYSKDEKKIRDHLVSRNAIDRCLKTFDSTFELYRNFMKNNGFEV